MKISRRPWGTADGEPVWLFDIEGEGIRAGISNYGGVIQSLEVNGPQGRRADVVLGYDTLDEYRRSDTFFGAMIGPIADRLAGGRCVLDGREVRLPLNAGPDSMHCADLGFHRAVWDWRALEDGLCLSRTFADAPGGFPGALSVELRCRIVAPRALRLEYEARCTRETAVSVTNHSYFNLSGARADCRDHLLRVCAGRYAQTTCAADPICTGRTLPVEGTPLDFRCGRTVGGAVDRLDFAEIVSAGGVDHYFLAEGEGMREVARLCCPGTGLQLRCLSDAPGLLVYTGNGLEGERGKGGAVYGKNWGVCLETARFPNAVNLPEWRPQVLLKPGERYTAATEFVFDW